MTIDELNLISGLFDRLAPLTQQPRDPEAESLIRSKVAEQPLAPYFLTQSTLVLQQAVTAAQSRIAALEKQIAETRTAQQPQGGFLSGVSSLFGGSPAVPAASRPASSPPASPAQTVPAGASGGGFLQNALATAAGVAGGAMLFQGIESLMGHGGASGFGGVGEGLGGNSPEIVNNYYGDAPDRSAGFNGDNDAAGLADNDQENDFSDAGGDDSLDFGGDDS